MNAIHKIFYCICVPLKNAAKYAWRCDWNAARNCIEFAWEELWKA